MLPTRLVALVVLGLLGLVYQSSMLAIAADEDALPTIVIRIKICDGNAGKYIKDGATTDDPVEVVVGQKVKWINDAPNSTHTATADKNNPATNKPLLTDDLAAGGTNSMEILFDQALFTAAGGDGHKSVDVKYHCTHHGQMHGVLSN